MSEGKTIEELGLSEFEITEIDGENLILLSKNIFKPEDNCPGFDFYCLEFYGQVMPASENPAEYTVVFEGTVYFDGVRHLYFGSEKTDNYGYLYYQDIPDLIKALQALDDMQVSRCEYVAKEREDD